MWKIISFANETLGTILIKCTNSIFGKMIYKLLANATNVEDNYLANKTLKNHKNVNIHLRRTVNLKNTLENNITFHWTPSTCPSILPSSSISPPSPTCMKSTPGWAQGETNACNSPCTIGMFKSRHNAYNLISLLPHPPLPFQISSIEWFTHGKLAKLPYISEIIQNLLASQLLHSHFVSESEIPKVKVKTRGQKIQKQHNEMIDERSNIEWILWTRKRPKQKEAKRSKTIEVKKHGGQK